MALGAIVADHLHLQNLLSVMYYDGLGDLSITWTNVCKTDSGRGYFVSVYSVVSFWRAHPQILPSITLGHLPAPDATAAAVEVSLLVWVRFYV